MEYIYMIIRYKIVHYLKRICITVKANKQIFVPCVIIRGLVQKTVNATNQGVTWSVTGAAAAGVTFGTPGALTTTFTAADTGAVIITVTTADGGETASRNYTVVTPVNVDSVSLDVADFELRVRADGTNPSSRTITATILPEEATNKAVTWEIDDESVAEITSTAGLTATVRAVGEGEAVITVTTENGGKTATADITVVLRGDDEVPVESVDLDETEETLWITNSNPEPNQYTFGFGEFTLTATVLPEGAYDKSLIWTSSDDDIAIVTGKPDGTATVKAVTRGTVTIRATSADNGEEYAECTVTVKRAVDYVSLTAIGLVLGETDTADAGYAVQPATLSPTSLGPADYESVSGWTWSIDDTDIATLSATDVEAPVITAVAVGETVLRLEVEIDGETFTGEAALVVTAPIAPSDTPFEISFSDNSTVVSITSDLFVRGGVTGDLVDGYEVMYAPRVDIEPPNDKMGWAVEFSLPNTIDISEYSGVNIFWGLSALPSGFVVDALGMLNCRLVGAGGMAVIGTGGWFQPAGGIVMETGAAYLDFDDDWQNWAQGFDAVSGAVSGIIMELEDGLVYDDNWGGNQHPGATWYIYSIEFVKGD